MLDRSAYAGTVTFSLQPSNNHCKEQVNRSKSSHVDRNDFWKSLLARGKQGLGLVMQTAWPKTQLQVAFRDVESDARSPPHDLLMMQRISQWRAGWRSCAPERLGTRARWHHLCAASCRGFCGKIFCHTMHPVLCGIAASLGVEDVAAFEYADLVC